MEIIRATPADATQLKAIAVAAKGHWGYAAQPMAQFAAEIMTNPQRLATDHVYIAMVDATIVAWVGVTPTVPTAMLDDLWVLPAYMGRGIGRTLFHHAVTTARGMGATALELDADPNATHFYARLGCVVIGETISEWGRAIPRMRLAIPPALGTDPRSPIPSEHAGVASGDVGSAAAAHPGRSPHAGSSALVGCLGESGAVGVAWAADISVDKREKRG